jgi:DNA processing protein
MELTRLRRGRPGYPPLLAQLHDPPAELYVRGEAGILAEPAVAIVGARSCSPYGTQIARSLARELAAAGLVVVSGLARGIDGEAHRGTLKAGGRTVAVLGCGIDRAPWRFPARNRIIAGLCAATVVVEARERSGALITADFALDVGREVFAVPGEITSALSAGTNDLLRQGAAPLLAAGDVLSALGLSPAPKRAEAVSEAAGHVFAQIADAAHDADGLARATGRSTGEVAAALVELELAGLVTQAEGLYRVSPGTIPAAPAPA